MLKPTVLALLCIWSGPLGAQYYEEGAPVPIRWNLSFGPTRATSSGRTTRLPVSSQCFSCFKTDEVVSGADRGEYHLGLGASGVPGRFGQALRLEIVFNRNSSDPYVAPAPTCVQLKCDQPRKAEQDNAFMMLGGVDLAPLDKKTFSPYVVLGGGFALNSLKWRQDSSTTSDLSGKAVAFGPVAALGGGVRATFRQWAAFVEWRQLFTFVTSGSQMTPLSFGVQYRAKRFGLGA